MSNATGSPNPILELLSLELGDILELPDGRSLAVRAIERKFEYTVGTMRGFLIAGEVGPESLLVSLPPALEGAVQIYVPLPDVPVNMKISQAVVAGVVSYWSPHLPGVSGAMGELGYKVCVVKGTNDPLVLIWRARELVVYVRSTTLDPKQFILNKLNRNPEATERDVQRLSAVVRSTSDISPQEEDLSKELYRTFTAK